MGKNGRIVAQTNFSLTLQNYSALSPMDFMNQMVAYLSNELPTMLDASKDTDLLNIRDEMLASTNKTKYLLTLK